jgi:hypothetical protein
MPQVISTSEPVHQEFVSKSHEWLVDNKGDIIGVRNFKANGNDLRPLPIALTAAQIAAPSADMLAANKYTYALDVAPFTRHRSNGTAFLAQLDTTSISSLASKLTEINVTVGTLAAGDITGAAYVSLVSINAVPGTQTTRTATQMFADQATYPVGSSYTLRITNTGAGTLTLGAGAGVTLTGTMTVPVNTTRDFIATFNSATTMTIRAIGTGTFS